MYNLKDIKDVHFEITSKCQAKCPMCPRRIAGGPLNPFIKLDEVSLETFKKWFPESFIKQLNSMFMCGNLGDPIISKDTLEIYQYLREVNPNISLAMHTNGSAREPAWWEKIAKVVNCHQKSTRARFCNLKKLQKCETVVKNKTVAKV